MIARIAIDSRSIVELLEQAPRNVIGRHGELTEVLRDHGVLLFTCQQDTEELKSAIAKQPMDVRLLWIETLKVLSGSGRWRPSRPALQKATSGLFDSGTYPRELRSQVDLVVVGMEVAEAVGFEQAGFGVLSSGLELVMPDVVQHCRTIQQIRDLQRLGNFPAGTARGSIWPLLFGPLAGASSEATILDRYLMKGLADYQGCPGDHVTWLLKNLDESASGQVHVRLLAEIPEPSRRGARSGLGTPSTAEFEQRLRTWLSRLHLAKVDLRIVLAPWSISNERGPHDRHLRFSCGSAVGVEEGFDRLKGETVWGVDGLSWKLHVHPEALKGLRRREQYIFDHAGRMEFMFGAPRRTR